MLTPETPPNRTSLRPILYHYEKFWNWSNNHYYYTITRNFEIESIPFWLENHFKIF